jgi:ABC-type branched-subunit amino acid transport system ATPase component/branched-subunit amino acid ABC-type transport system permease component
VSSLLIYALLSLPLIGAYMMMSIGIVVVFRASRVLNLAHGAMAMLPAYIVYAADRAGLNLVLCLLLGLVGGGLLGMAVERFFIRPLSKQGPTAQTVGTVAVYGLVVAVAAQIWGSGAHLAPQVFPAGGVPISNALLRWGQLGLFAIGLVAAVGFVALFRFTWIGLAMRASAENPRAASLMGVSPQLMARLAWLLGGSLAGLAGILLAAVTNLQPYSLSLQMLPAFVAALIGGLESVPGAVVGSFIVGVTQGIVPAFASLPVIGGFASQAGVPELALTVLALLVMYLRGQRFSSVDIRASLGNTGEAGNQHSVFDVKRVRNPGGGRRAMRFALLAVLVGWPILGQGHALFGITTFTLLGTAILACQYFLVASSIVMLTGWVGQISLSQAAFVGISAFSSAIIATHAGIVFPYSLLVGGVVAAFASALLGVVALRVRGLYLAVATLIFTWMADQYLFVAPWFAGNGGSVTAQPPSLGVQGAYPSFDFTQRSTMYFVMLAVAAVVLFALKNLRDSKTGRAFAAVRGSEMAAGSLGIDVIRSKLLAFAAAGFIAGLAGNLILASQVTVVPGQFNLSESLLFLAIAVVGGLRSLGGAVAASMLFAGLSEVFFQIPALGTYLQLVSAALLALVLLVYPGGLAALPGTVNRLLASARSNRVLRGTVDTVGAAGTAALAYVRTAARELTVARRAVVRQVAPPDKVVPLLRVRGGSGSPRITALSVSADSLFRRRSHPGTPSRDEADPAQQSSDLPEAKSALSLPAVGSRRLALEDVGEPFRAEGAVLEAANITVRFGGLTAVDEASLIVRGGQIVGLIGPNGAGKTTLFNSISGLNIPTSGTVHLFDKEVTNLPVHKRAAMGLGRTFQVIQLFPELTVFENLMVATHLQNPTGLLSNLLVSGRAFRAEVAAEETCRRVVRFLGIEEVADRQAGGLPFGTLRLVEIARALVTGAPVLMLDEPASGLDNRETERLSELLLFIRNRLGVSILLIEHDVAMVTGVSDYMYVLNRGRILAQGVPAAIQRDPAVIAAYLGEMPSETVA